MKHRLWLGVCALALILASVGCGKGEETTVSGMVVSVEGTVVSIMDMDSVNIEISEEGMPERPENFKPEEFDGKMPEGFNPEEFDGEMPEGFNPEEFEGEIPEGFNPEDFDGEMPEGFNPEEFDGEMPEDFEGKMPGGFGGGMPNMGENLEDVETTEYDIADAHISVEIDGGKESGSMDNITRGTMVTITLDKKGNATYVLVTSSGMKFM